ncbi:MAG: nucleoside deaminase [Gemmataceae bacterium]
MNDSLWMRLAIDKTRAGIAAGQSPFGAVIVRGGQLVCAAHNSVWRDCDPTAHAEVNAIREAAKILATIGLRDCAMFATCEPCPMCLSALHWAKIDRVVFGADIRDATSAGFSELAVPARVLAEMGGSPLRVEGGLLADECRELFQTWLNTPGHQTY